MTSSCGARLEIKINPCVACNVYTLKNNTSYVVLYLLVRIFSNYQIYHRVSHTQDYHRYVDNEGRLKGTPVSFARLVVSDWFIFVVNMSDSCCLRNCSLFNGRLDRFVLLRDGAYIVSITISSKKRLDALTRSETSIPSAFHLVVQYCVFYPAHPYSRRSFLMEY